MADGKISSMVVATETKTTDLFEISQLVGGPGSERVTRANDLQSIAVFLHEVMQNNALTTTEKTLVNAINELARLRTFNSGDTISFPSQSAVFSGYVTGSNKSIYFYVPLPKPPKGIASATVTGAIGCRSAKGIINGGALDLSNYEVTATVTNYGVGINVKATTEFTAVDNNTNIVVSPSSSGLRITFS